MAKALKEEAAQKGQSLFGVRLKKISDTSRNTLARSFRAVQNQSRYSIK
jgi:hypothetical protein